MKKKLYKYKEQPTNEQRYSLDSIHLTYTLPARVVSWLRSYHITDDDIRLHNFGWDDEKSSLVMPVLDGDRVVHVTCRYFGDNPDHPKYITKGYKNQHFKCVFPIVRSNIWVLCEDYISAIRIGRYANAIPLFGTYCPRELLYRLLTYRPILRFWLDRDKASVSVKQAASARQYIEDCATIVTELDPKDYTDEQIKRIIDESLSHTIESLPQ